MKILLSLIGRIINSTGGVEKVACNMANALAERGHEVTLLAFEDKEGKPFFPLRENVKFVNLGKGFKYNHTLFNLKNVFCGRDSKEVKRLLFDCSQIATHIEKRIQYILPDVIITFEKRSDVLFKEFIHFDNTPPDNYNVSF